MSVHLNRVRRVGYVDNWFFTPCQPRRSYQSDSSRGVGNFAPPYTELSSVVSNRLGYTPINRDCTHVTLNFGARVEAIALRFAGLRTFRLRTFRPRTFRLRTFRLLSFHQRSPVQFSSVQDGIYAPEKAHMRSTPIFQEFPQCSP